jgi:hypothetical protein
MSGHRSWNLHEKTRQESELILYRTADDAVHVEVLYESETWLDQRRIAELFGADIRTVSYHLKEEVHASGELRPGATLRKNWRVQRGEDREGVCEESARLIGAGKKVIVQ